ncbi:hypothetical protein AVEN_196611-1 [Araneus ventricosus]|uniref:Uncharacterized protein n=1 Tax=Araneus ventricosus TaxID=182803 RepID=A0A4Y2GSB0_ARAVE|nr:hypothetical protein AVEN_196611-1 [Araneus ventricosus]
MRSETFSEIHQNLEAPFFDIYNTFSLYEKGADFKVLFHWRNTNDTANTITVVDIALSNNWHYRLGNDWFHGSRKAPRLSTNNKRECVCVGVLQGTPHVLELRNLV